MLTKNFKQILLRKTNDKNIIELLDTINDCDFNNLLIESLEKMAAPTAHMGRNPNAALMAFSNDLSKKDVHMMHDALSHHISHYQSALKQGKPEIADQHLNKIVPLMHLAAKTSAHAHDKVAIDYPHMEAWETNYTGTRRNDKGKLHEGTKGLNRKPNSNVNRDLNPHGVPDYKYLQMPPHPEHKDAFHMSTHGGYPFEEVLLGEPNKVNAKQAYAHVEDIPNVDKYVSHEFDHHPIHDTYNVPQAQLTPAHMDQFAKDIADWHNSEHSNNFMQRHKQAYADDKEKYLSRGQQKAKHVFDNYNLMKMPHHSNTKVSNNAPSDLQDTQKPTATVAPKQSKQSATPQTKSASLEQLFNDLPAELKEKYADLLKLK